MNLEQLFSDFAEDLDGFIDTKKILSNNSSYASFTSILLKTRANLPEPIQQQVQKNINWLKCNKCWDSAVNEYFECGHGFCNNCKASLTPNKCLCGYETFSSETRKIEPHICQRCENTIKFIDGNCIDFCYDCTVELVNINKQSQCPKCYKHFLIYECKGNCSACKIYSNLYVLCANHYHCLTCSSEDLKHLKCCECDSRLIPMSVAIFYSKIYPVCGLCKTRNNYRNSYYFECCGSYYCLMCITTFVRTLCYCGKPMNEAEINFIKQILNGVDRMNQAFELFCAGV